MSDHHRPADYQVDEVYQCRRCGDEQVVPSCYAARMPCPRCGGFVDKAGESYPADSSEWDEVRTKDGHWINKNDMTV